MQIFQKIYLRTNEFIPSFLLFVFVMFDFGLLLNAGIVSTSLCLIGQFLLIGCKKKKTGSVGEAKGAGKKNATPGNHPPTSNTPTGSTPDPSAVKLDDNDKSATNTDLNTHVSYFEVLALIILFFRFLL